MKEHISWKGEKKTYQPRIKEGRIRDLHKIREFNDRPMTVMIDEALAVYITSFYKAMEITPRDEAIFKAIDEWDDPSGIPGKEEIESTLEWFDLYAGEANTTD